MYTIQNKQNSPTRVIIGDRELSVGAFGTLDVDTKDFEKFQKEILAQDFMVIKRPEKKETVKPAKAKKKKATSDKSGENEPEETIKEVNE